MVNIKVGTSCHVSGPGVVMVQNKVNIKIIQQAGWSGPSPNKAYTPPPGMPTRGGSTAPSGGGASIERTRSESVSNKGKELTPTEKTDPNEKTPPPGDRQLVPVHQAQSPRQYPLAAIRAILGGDAQRICHVLNMLLAKNALLQAYLPFRDEDLFEKLENGVVLCAMANQLQPSTINEKSIAVLPPKKGSPVEMAKNINLALMSLNTLGISLGDPESEINAQLLHLQSALHLIAILLQWIRLITVGRMSLRHSPQLAYTLEDTADRPEITAMHSFSPEDMLLRWVNYQLWKAGKGLVMSSFDPRNDDSTIYAHVLYTVAPPDKQASMIQPQSIIDEKDPTKRAVMVVKNATVLGLGEITGPELILPISASNSDENENAGALMRSSMLRPVLFSQAFAKYPNIAKPAGSKQEDENSLFEELKVSTKQGTREETLVMWLNSFGPSSPVTLINEDLRSGVILLQVLEVMYPNCVNWSKVNLRSYPKLDPKVLEKSSFKERVTDARRKFNWLANCSLVIEIVELQKLKVNCSANDIATGETKNTLALVFVLMLKYAHILHQKALGGETKELTDQELVKWFNERLTAYGSSFQIKNINDPALKKTNALGFVGERLLAVELAAAFGEVSQELGRSKSQSSSQPKPYRSTSNVEDQASGIIEVPDGESNIKSSSNIENQTSMINEPDSLSNFASNSNVENQGVDDLESSNAVSAWHFESVQELTGHDIETCSYTTIALLRQGGVRVYTKKLGPECDVLVYRNLLLQLNAIANKKT